MFRAWSPPPNLNILIFRKSVKYPIPVQARGEFETYAPYERRNTNKRFRVSRLSNISLKMGVNGGEKGPYPSSVELRILQG